MLNEIKEKVDAFFVTATDDEIRMALKDAGYQTYTGVDPMTLELRPNGDG